MDKQKVEDKASGQDWHGHERRKHARFACEGAAEVIVHDAEFLFRGEICDLSLSGCFVRSRARLRLRRNQEVEIYFSLENEQVKCSARVMSLHPGKGVGFEFLPMTDRGLRSLRALIRKLEEDVSSAVVVVPDAT